MSARENLQSFNLAKVSRYTVFRAVYDVIMSPQTFVSGYVTGSWGKGLLLGDFFPSKSSYLVLGSVQLRP